MNRPFFGLMLILVVLHLGCSQANTNSMESRAVAVVEAEKENAGPIHVDIEDLLAHPEDYKDRVVTIEGLFRGWSGSCKSAPPETRSDWMVDADNGCVYVSGPVPEGYSTVPGSPSLGKSISVTGRVLLDGNSRPYLKITAP